MAKPDAYIVEDLLEKYSPVSTMVSRNHLRIVLTNLKRALDANVEGAVVELGCNRGTTSLFIRRLLDRCEPGKEFRVYDSFQGLPEKHALDNAEVKPMSTLLSSARRFLGFSYNMTNNMFVKGSAKAKKELLIENFEDAGLELPEIHSGWFGKLPDSEFPGKVCFAFFDSDFYSSITDSFERIYPRMPPGARLAVHDYGWRVLPGVKAACDDFLRDKPENGTVIADDFVGVMVKK